MHNYFLPLKYASWRSQVRSEDVGTLRSRHDRGLKFFVRVSPPCIAHNSTVRHDIVTIPNEPTNPPSHLSLLSLAMPLYPVNPKFFIKVSVSRQRE
ncbi:hypothetical protein H5410_051473 [Solanum commersonii]|uniref:Uncharacterized protein n=1 Tax=Solanum commersonii TaxID=4109 RepID=A0A9J5X0T2_SOLCO|nr:hypothetical protein H5410_051473 [Solanum commersonii]